MSNPSLNDNVKQIIESLQEQLGFSIWGASEFATPQSITFYKAWLENQYHGEMKYLNDHLPLKEFPQTLSQQKNAYFRNALVFAFEYLPHPEPIDLKLPLNIAKYAQGADYHFWLKQRLDKIVSNLKSLYPAEDFLTATDSMPILERDLAYRAGLGWFGKNTCLIHPKKGSFFLIGEILTSLDLQVQQNLTHDFCGTCTKCIDSCPTNAILPNKVVDATKCISYLTIEAKDVPPPELREKIGDLFFGCDICQDVCPWNIKALKANVKYQPKATDSVDVEAELKFILNSSGKLLTKHYANSPLSRARPFGLKRNAIIVATNLKLKNLKPDIAKLKDDEKLSDLCAWSLNKLQD